MSERLRRWLIPAGLLLVLVAVNVAIWQKERILDEGATVSLPLAPVDPRSLMQGDYMALDWQLGRELAQRRESLPETGRVVLRFVGGGTRAEFARLDDGGPLAADEIRLVYRMRGETVRVATDAYFFQEGTAESFSGARFGELRVGRDGTAILVGLQDGNLVTLKPVAPPPGVEPEPEADTTGAP